MVSFAQKFPEKKKELSDIAKKAVQNPGKIKDRFVDKEFEKDTLREMKSRLRREFDSEIKIVNASDSDLEKAKRAEPGKPAIVFE